MSTDHAASDTTLFANPFPGEFRLVRHLGRGTFGEVWLAEDLSPLRRLVALKFLRPADEPDKSRRALELLQNEARILASLRHPNIVQVHAWREAAGTGQHCLVLQFVPGGSLDRPGSLPWGTAARYVADVADGLSLLHARGIIHRDVKPANILHDPETDEALLTDFGVAAHLAGPGSVGGTPLHMAPEAFDGVVLPSLDVYGLASSLFRLVTGEPPFDAPTRATLRERKLRGLDAADPRFASMPADLERLVRAGLSPAPADRPGLAAFLHDLRGTLNRLMADCLTLPTPQETAPAAEVRIVVSRQNGPASVLPSDSTVRPPDTVLRDLKRVPASPPRVTLHTGERVRIEVAANREGYLTVFNVGPTGNLNLLHPQDPGEAPPLQPAGQVLHVTDVVLTPPAGKERLFALWTRHPLPVRLDDLASLAGSGTLPVAYTATRDMVRVQQKVSDLPARDRQAAVLELDHREP